MENTTSTKGPDLQEIALGWQPVRVEIRKSQLRLGRWLDELDGTRAYKDMACASIGGFGEEQGFSAKEARILVRVARATSLDARVEPYLLDGRISLEAAALLLKALTLPGREGLTPPDWVERATEVPTRRLEEEISEFAARVRAPAPPTRVTAWLSDEGMRTFRRARRLVRRAARKAATAADELTNGDVIVRLAEDYLARHDRLGWRGRLRRVPDTRGRAGRYVPHEVGRAVFARDENRCVVGLCHHDTWLHQGHVQAHRSGGDREKANVAVICSCHNQMCETGHLTLRGTADDLVCLDRHGRVVPRSRRPLERRLTFEEWTARRAGAA